MSSEDVAVCSERAAVVAWLRNHAQVRHAQTKTLEHDSHLAAYCEGGVDAVTDVAEQIERGLHRKEARGGVERKS
jgi:hypothetical protein